MANDLDGRGTAGANPGVARVGAAALAVGAGLGVPAQSQASVIIADLGEIIRNDTRDIDFELDGSVEFTLEHVSIPYGTGTIDTARLVYGDAGDQVVVTDLSPYFPALPFNDGDTIGPATPGMDATDTTLAADYRSIGGYYYAPPDDFMDKGPAFIGMSFDAADGRHYGWIHVEVVREPTSAAAYINLFGFAYETEPDKAIGVGSAVPEPQSLLLLAAGAAPVLALRRRRRGKKVQD